MQYVLNALIQLFGNPGNENGNLSCNFKEITVDILARPYCGWGTQFKS
jgi:hypothetical protein